ncbi:acyl-CoA dehydrogenase family protein [Phenylobacterium sp. J426]|uniref:acyl-CoA dehydrogenase family protein n=1 Tax=Phenylobacterium sp. J426 TaxID=2898439 RepID=UPI00215080F6|nr:acyl-CoA dehydrogenase family protein [Phenylobacterium sp. J426]MCR5876495.1 acyl-CoA dehydrogenase family protein [Phenylobacterium sp. J426]MCR5876786.1 acyl-CoA dehydrogenase family protein [Phenylobacterium sp. J426]
MDAAVRNEGEDFPTGAWELPEELKMLQETVRRFMETEVRPLEETLPHDAFGLPPELLKPLQAKARALGLWSLATPKAYGGAGMGVLAQTLVAEEAAKCRMGAYFPALGAFGGDPPNVLLRGTPEQFERYAKPIIENGGKAFSAISEPSGGSDPARSIRCRAELRGDHYVLNGTKLWITAAGSAKYGVVYARTGELGQRGGITCFIVESDTPGLTMRPVGVIRSYSPYELHFENVKVPVENRLGEEGQGFKLAETWLVHARMPYAAGTIGIAQYALDLAIEWAKSREVFGSPLAEKQAIQWMIADSEIELRAARLLTYQAAWNADLGKDVKVDASVCKVFGTETAFRVVDRCIQIFGAMGVAQELPLERWFRELRIKRIGEGPSEVHRMVVSRSLLSGRR